MWVWCGGELAFYAQLGVVAPGRHVGLGSVGTGTEDRAAFQVE